MPKLSLRTWRSQRILSFAVLRETGCKYEPVLQVDGPGGLVPLMSHGLLLDIAGSRIDSTDFSILASENYVTSVPVPASGVDQI